MVLHQEKLDKAKNKIKEATGLRPMNEKLLKGNRFLKIPPHREIRCGSYWHKIPGYRRKMLGLYGTSSSH